MLETSSTDVVPRNLSKVRFLRAPSPRKSSLLDPHGGCREDLLMSLETLIPYIVEHNALIIQILVVTILLMVVFVAYRNFASAKSGAVAGTGADLSQLEGTLKKLLEKANAVPVASAVAAGENSALLGEIEKLKKSLEEKQGQIEKLKGAQAEAASAAAAGGEAAAAAVAAAATAQMSSADQSALDAQIKELQAKLSEYEIISEDIADLSFYKEENSKLQKELEVFKKGGAAPAAAAPAPAATATPAAPAPPTAPAAAPEAAKPAPAMAGSAKATNAAKGPEGKAAPTSAAPTPAPATPSAAPAAPATPAAVAPAATPASAPAAASAEAQAADDDLMKEFEMAVEAQKHKGPAPVAAPGAAAPAAAPAPAATPGAPKDQAKDDSPLGSGLDVDKVAAEVSQFADNVGDVNVLEGELNPDKLLEEAASMDSIKPEDAKLMNEFEDFVKKGGVG